MIKRHVTYTSKVSKIDTTNMENFGKVLIILRNDINQLLHEFF